MRCLALWALYIYLRMALFSLSLEERSRVLTARFEEEGRGGGGVL